MSSTSWISLSIRYNRLVWIARLGLVLCVALYVGCGGDDGGGGGVADAAGDPNADARTAVDCPPTDDLQCEFTTSVCVIETPVGPAMRSSCQPVPTGCEADRSCDCVGATLCQAPFDLCQDGADNQVTCECVNCQ